MRTALPALLFLAACEQAAAPPAPPSGEQAMPAHEVFVSGLVVRLNPVPGRPAAAYFTLAVPANDLRLTGVNSPNASRVELHETMAEGGMARMVPLDPATLDLRKPVAFAPGGKHAMLYDVSGLRPGGDAALLFTFTPVEGGPPVRVPATGTVQAAGGEMGQMGH